MNIATGSASELEYHFLLARDLGFLPEPDYQKVNQAVVEVKRMLAALVRKIDADRLARASPCARRLACDSRKSIVNVAFYASAKNMAPLVYV